MFSQRRRRLGRIMTRIVDKSYVICHKHGEPLMVKIGASASSAPAIPLDIPESLFQRNLDDLSSASCPEDQIRIPKRATTLPYAFRTLPHAPARLLHLLLHRTISLAGTPHLGQLVRLARTMLLVRTWLPVEAVQILPGLRVSAIATTSSTLRSQVLGSWLLDASVPGSRFPVPAYPWFLVPGSCARSTFLTTFHVLRSTFRDANPRCQVLPYSFARTWSSIISVAR